jgi:hypothetical protein
VEEKIKVKGLAELNRALRRLDSEAPKQLRIVHNEAAALLIDRVRPEIPTRTGAARRSLAARSTRTAARIAVGGKRAPYYPWLDFGGQGRHKGRPAHRPFIRVGRYIYPTLRKVRPEIEEKLAEGLSAAVANAGLEES